MSLHKHKSTQLLRTRYIYTTQSVNSIFSSNYNFYIQSDLVKTVEEQSGDRKDSVGTGDDRKRSRTRSRTYSIDVVNHPELIPVIEKTKFTAKHCYIMIPASFCDMCGTSLMYVALTLTSAASFQMIRGIYSNTRSHHTIKYSLIHFTIQLQN